MERKREYLRLTTSAAERPRAVAAAPYFVVEHSDTSRPSIMTDYANLIAALRTELDALAEKNAGLKAQIAGEAQAYGIALGMAREEIDTLRRKLDHHRRTEIAQESYIAEQRRANALSDKCGAIATELRNAHATIGRLSIHIERLEKEARRK